MLGNGAVYEVGLPNGMKEMSRNRNGECARRQEVDRFIIGHGDERTANRH